MNNQQEKLNLRNYILPRYTFQIHCTQCYCFDPNYNATVSTFSNTRTRCFLKSSNLLSKLRHCAGPKDRWEKRLLVKYTKGKITHRKNKKF